MFICEKCNRPFLMKDYLRNHVCDAEKQEEATSEPVEKTRKELIAEAKEIGITGSDRMSKEDLIRLIEEAR